MSQTADVEPKFRLQLDRGPALVFGGLALAFCFAFFNGIENLLKRWGEQQELSHGYFLPLISAWMLWSRREAIVGSLGKPAALGLAGVALAALILILSELTVTSLMVFQHLAMILLFSSLALALGGRGVFWVTLLPIGFLLFMVPPPYWVITVLSWNFQFWSSELGVWMISLAGIPVFLSGNIIDLGDYQLQVAEACSGLRYLFPFLSLGFLAAYLYHGPMWQRAVVFLSTVPITIVMNSFRVAVTAILVQRFGTQHAEGILHMFEGWVVFVMCMGLLFLVILGLSRLSGRKKKLADLLALPDVAPRTGQGAFSAELFRRNAAIAIAILFAAGAVVRVTGDDTLRVPARADLDGLLAEFEGWRTDPREIDAATLTTLGADDYLVADLVNPDGEAFNLYIAYLNMQRDGHSWHSPRQCIPGGGWKIVSHEILPAQRADGRRYHYNRILIENRGARQLVYYWYDQRGRKIANEFVMKFALIFDAVRMLRTDGAMIRAIAPVYPGEPIEAADARLRSFVETLEPKLESYIPPAGAALTPTSE